MSPNSTHHKQQNVLPQFKVYFTCGFMVSFHKGFLHNQMELNKIQATTLEQLSSTPTWLNLLPNQDNTSIMYILVFIFLTMSWTRNCIIHTIILSWLNLFLIISTYVLNIFLYWMWYKLFIYRQNSFDWAFRCYEYK